MTMSFAAKLGKSILAATLGAIVGPVTFLVAAMLFWRPAFQALYDAFAGFDDSDDNSYAGSYPFGVCIIGTLLAMFIISLPVQALLQRLRIVAYSYSLAAYLVCGLALSAAWTTVLDKPEISPLIFGAGLTFCSTSVFWLIRRPDLDGQVTAKRPKPEA